MSLEYQHIRIKDRYNGSYTEAGRLAYEQGIKDRDPKFKRKGLKFLAAGLIKQNPTPSSLKFIEKLKKEQAEKTFLEPLGAK